MTMKKTALLISLLLLISSILVGCGKDSTSGTSNNATASEGDPLSISIGHTLAPESHYHVMATKMAEIAAEKSDGKIEIKVFPQSQLGGEVKMIQGARSGTLDMLVTAQAPLTTTIEEYALFDIPYLFDSIDQANGILAGPVGDKFLDMLPEHDMVGLGWLSVMERNVFASKPVKSVKDLESFKIRVMQSPGYVEAYEAYGAQPTPMAYSELYMSLQQGLVDGGDTSPDQFVMDKFDEVAKYYNLTKTHHLPALLIVSKKKWDSYSEEQKEILNSAAEEALAYGIDYYKQSYDESIEKMKEANVEVVETDLDSLKAESEKVNESLLSEIPDGEQLFEEIQKEK